jgi:hypothetical protein
MNITEFTTFGQKIQLLPRKTLYKTHKAIGLWLRNENKILFQESTEKYPMTEDVISQAQCHEIVHVWLDKTNYLTLSDNEGLVDRLGACLNEFLLSKK